MPLSLPPGGQLLRMLCVGAHCDDIEIGCGGTILTLSAARPIDATWVVLSSDDLREKEARAAAARFLAKAKSSTVDVKRFRNGFFPHEGAEIKDYFESLKVLPAFDLILTHTSDDRHQDHRVVNELTWNTFRNHTVLEYEIPKYDGDLGRPSVYVPLTKAVLAEKVRIAMESFASQCDKHWFSGDLFTALARLRGMECVAPEGHAEAFYARKIVVSAG
ncbi:MAG TPA: PIG-L family deacetylase [Candidatus Polarisedimenticolaceae bacterium]|nr:PIG-L family deacetylase [Candidatus Polarisedimenticolaceae bacterium]